MAIRRNLVTTPVLSPDPTLCVPKHDLRRSPVKSTVTMFAIWNTLLASWDGCKSCTKRPGTLVDIELGEHFKVPGRVDSKISLKSLKSISSNRSTPKLDNTSQYCEDIRLTFNFGDVVHTKQLNYGTFACWDAMEELIKDVERDGFVVKELWDDIEEMKVYSGDWDARVRSGWDIHVHCEDALAPTWKDDDGESDSERYENEDERTLVDEIIAGYQEDWCLLRWRSKVEQERSTAVQVLEPSWLMLALGSASMIFFLVTVIVYTI